MSSVDYPIKLRRTFIGFMTYGDGSGAGFTAVALATALMWFGAPLGALGILSLVLALSSWLTSGVRLYRRTLSCGTILWRTHYRRDEIVKVWADSVREIRPRTNIVFELTNGLIREVKGSDYLSEERRNQWIETIESWRTQETSSSPTPS